MKNLDKFKKRRVEFDSVSSKINSIMNFESVSSKSISVKFVQIYGRAEFQKIVQNQNKKIRWIELNELGFGVIQAVKNWKMTTFKFF